MVHYSVEEITVNVRKMLKNFSKELLVVRALTVALSCTVSEDADVVHIIKKIDYQ
jgi:hypothetical protein